MVTRKGIEDFGAVGLPLRFKLGVCVHAYVYKYIAHVRIRTYYVLKNVRGFWNYTFLSSRVMGNRNSAYRARLHGTVAKHC